MSYRCQICNAKVPLKKKVIRLITDKRVKFYPYRPKANPGYQTKNGQVLRPLRKSKKKSDRTDDPGGKGWEMVGELCVCEACSKVANSESIL